MCRCRRYSYYYELQQPVFVIINQINPLASIEILRATRLLVEDTRGQHPRVDRIRRLARDQAAKRIGEHQGDAGIEPHVIVGVHLPEASTDSARRRAGLLGHLPDGR